MAQTVKNLPGIWVQPLGWEDLLEKAMATHSSILAWEISWTEEPGGLQFMGLQSIRHNWASNTVTINYIIPGGTMVKNLPTNARDAGSGPWSGRYPGGGNGNPFQYSCLGQRSLVGYSPWGFKELDITEHSHKEQRTLEQGLVIFIWVNVKKTESG